MNPEIGIKTFLEINFKTECLFFNLKIPSVIKKIPGINQICEKENRLSKNVPGKIIIKTKS